LAKSSLAKTFLSQYSYYSYDKQKQKIRVKMILKFLLIFSIQLFLAKSMGEFKQVLDFSDHG